MYALVICSNFSLANNLTLYKLFQLIDFPKCILDLTINNFRLIITDVQSKDKVDLFNQERDLLAFQITQLSAREVTLCMQISVTLDFSGADFDNLVFLLQLIAKKLSLESKNLLDTKIEEIIESLSFVI